MRALVLHCASIAGIFVVFPVQTESTQMKLVDSTRLCMSSRWPVLWALAGCTGDEGRRGGTAQPVGASRQLGREAGERPQQKAAGGSRSRRR